MGLDYYSSLGLTRCVDSSSGSVLSRARWCLEMTRDLEEVAWSFREGSACAGLPMMPT